VSSCHVAASSKTNHRTRYIIDHYDTLPQSVFFLHSSRYQWHNDDQDYDGVFMLQQFRMPHLFETGYVNLRCAWILGCPIEIRPEEESKRVFAPEERENTGYHYKKAFEELFPEEKLPYAIGIPCCSQFAVSRDVLLRVEGKDTRISEIGC
jgi:hypothetical protein